MSIRLKTIIALGMTALLALSNPALAEKRVALVIGNGTYQHTIKLPNPPNDAQVLGAKLEQLGFEVMSLKNQSSKEMQGGLAKFRRRLAGAEIALVFYAGHGIQANGENYLVPVDADLKDEADLSFETIALSDVMKQLSAGGARLNLVILDACRDNPLTETLTQASRSLGRSSGVGRGLARVDSTPPETMVVFATEANKIALDGTGGNSPFTVALIKALDRPGLKVEEIWKDVRRDVMAATTNGQGPTIYGLLTGTYVLNGAVPITRPMVAPSSGTTTTAPATSVDPIMVEMAFWNSVERSPGATELQAYLAKYPSGQFVDLAKSRLLAQEKTVTTASAQPQQQVASLPPSSPYSSGADPTATSDEIRKAADQWNADGQNKLGNMYRLGEGVTQDYAEAVKWYRKAADQGDAKGQINLGAMYRLGYGVTQDYAEAVKWFRKAADQGDAKGQINLGAMYGNGHGVTQDHAEAVKWFRKAAKGGNKEAQSKLEAMGENVD